MVTQITLFHESELEALATDVMALGGKKAVGIILWPELPADRAGAKLSDCLNSGHAQVLHLDQAALIVKLAKETGSFATATYRNQEAGFEPPAPINPEDEKAKLQRQVVQSVDDLKSIMKRLERLA